MEIEIRNWNKYNPKRDQKTYSWVRLNNDLFSGQDFSDYGPLDLVVWICLLCEASKKNTPNIDIKAGFIQRVTKLTLNEICEAMCKLHNDKFIEIKGAVAPLQHATALLHFATPTYERTYERTNEYLVDQNQQDFTHPLEIPNSPKEKKPKELKPISKLENNANGIAAMWNVIAQSEKLPLVKVPLSQDRIKLMKAPLDEFKAAEDWERIIAQVAENPFNLGDNDRKWKANFDWLFHKTKFNYRKLWEEATSEQVEVEA